MSLSSTSARDTLTYPSPPENDDSSSGSDVSEGEPQEDEDCSFWQILILLGVGVVLVGVPLVVVIACCCCVRDDAGSEVSQPPSLPQPSTSTGPNDSEPGTTEAELGARADSTRARCDVKSIKTGGEKKIIWTFWHEKKPPLRVQQMIESWKERAPTWQVCQTYLWDNVGEVRHFGQDQNADSTTFWFGTEHKSRGVLLHDIRRLGAAALEPPLESSSSSGLAFATLKGPIERVTEGDVGSFLGASPGADRLVYKMTFDFRGKRDATAFYVRRAIADSMTEKNHKWEWRYHPDENEMDSYLAFQLAYETELPSEQRKLVPHQILERVVDKGSLPDGFFPPREFYGKTEREFWPELEKGLRKTYGENVAISFTRVVPTEVSAESDLNGWTRRVIELVEAERNHVPSYVPEEYPHKSDLLRCLFLSKFGGLWLDASSVIVQDKILQDIDTKQREKPAGYRGHPVHFAAYHNRAFTPALSFTNLQDWVPENAIMWAAPNAKILNLWAKKIAENYGFLRRNQFWAQTNFILWQNQRDSPQGGSGSGSGSGTSSGGPPDPGYMANFLLFKAAMLHMNTEETKKHLVDLGDTNDVGGFAPWGIWFPEFGRAWDNPPEAMKRLGAWDNTPGQYADVLRRLFVVKLIKPLRDALLDQSLEISPQSWWGGFGLS